MAAPVTDPRANGSVARPDRRSAVVSPAPVAVWLAGVVAVRASVANLVGLLWTGGHAPATFVSVHGETVELFGTDLYRYDSLLKGAGNRGSDLFALVVGVPALTYAAVRYGRASTRGALLFAGVLLWSPTCT